MGCGSDGGGSDGGGSDDGWGWLRPWIEVGSGRGFMPWVEVGSGHWFVSWVEVGCAGGLRPLVVGLWWMGCWGGG